MKKLFYWVFAATLVCGEGMLTSCANDSADNPVVTPRQRVINFEGIDNARDMGSLVMQDGRIVRFDMLVRSGKLAKATDADVAILQSQYHLSDVFDFRFDLEMTEAPEYRLSENFIVPYVDNVYPIDFKVLGTRFTCSL